jgi:hypothetical protein
MKTLFATAALLMAIAAGVASLVTAAMADPASRGTPLQVASWTLPGVVAKERNYSVPVQNSDRCDCSGERGCITRIQCLDTGGRCGRDC